MTEAATTSTASPSNNRGKGRATTQTDEVQDYAGLIAQAQEQAQEAVLDQAVQRLREELGGHQNGNGGQKLVTTARQQLVAQLADLDQEHAREQLLAATRSGEAAAAGAVQGVATLLRSVLPTGLIHPEEVIDTAFGLAEQGLRVLQRTAHELVGAARELAAA
jgi:hypothetical protein